jgi:hypothetical protein
VARSTSIKFAASVIEGAEASGPVVLGGGAGAEPQSTGGVVLIGERRNQPGWA